MPGSNRHLLIYGNFMHSSVPRQMLFLGAVPITSRYYLQEYKRYRSCSNYLPLLFTRIYNATETL